MVKNVIITCTRLSGLFISEYLYKYIYSNVPKEDRYIDNKFTSDFSKGYINIIIRSLNLSKRRKNSEKVCLQNGHSTS